MLNRQTRKNHRNIQDGYVSDVQQIKLALIQLQQRSTSIKVEIGNTPTVFFTTLLAVNSKDNSLLIDELLPEDNKKLLTNTRELKLSAETNDGILKFHARYKESCNEKGQSFHKLQIPHRLEFVQRRQFQRTALDGAAKSTVVFRLKDGQIAKGRITDISVGGFGAIFDFGTLIEEFMIVADATLNIHGFTIHNPVEIRYIFTGPFDSKLKIGAQFIDPTETTERDIASLLSLLESQYLSQTTDVSR